MDTLPDKQEVVGQACGRGLPWEDFAHLGAPIGMAADVLKAAAARSEPGVHIVLVGPPSTGKIELAQALASQAGVALFAAWENADEAGDVRVHPVVRRQPRQLLQGVPQPDAGGGPHLRALDLQRHRLDDAATLRRMTLVARVGVPDAAGRERIWARVLHRERLALPDDPPARLAARWVASVGMAAAKSHLHHASDLA